MLSREIPANELYEKKKKKHISRDTQNAVEPYGNSLIHFVSDKCLTGETANSINAHAFSSYCLR